MESLLSAMTQRYWKKLLACLAIISGVHRCACAGVQVDTVHACPAVETWVWGAVIHIWSNTKKKNKKKKKKNHSYSRPTCMCAESHSHKTIQSAHALAYEYKHSLVTKTEGHTK